MSNDKVDNTIRYCKICIKELEKSQQSPYPYTKSDGSIENLAQHLYDKHNITAKNYKDYLNSEKKDNETISPLEVLMNSIRILAASLQNKSDAALRKEIKEIVEVLKPVEEITRHICDAKYPTMNLVYPYIRILKNKYTPVAEKGKLVESWLDLIYKSSLESSDQIVDSDTSISNDDEADILSAGNRKQ
ncbi:700_t:CDS:2 [Scutellospora calospora]|uniref:700_t:CDS:1 n=1 Tax=Scutellospora calospora TaxID=85575 RepID=A0ACA9JXA1_9GLOM|nr:700_t:CDS:2 [Scutellospora calospora]